MADPFTAVEICEKALRKIGSFSINDTAADKEEVDEALSWLDACMSHLGGSSRIFFLVPGTLSLSLTGGTASYDLTDELSASLDGLGVQFPISANLKDSSGNETPLTIIKRGQYEEIADKDATGAPTMVYIDRLKEPTLTTYPVLDSNASGYTIELVVQQYSKDYKDSTGDTITQLRAAWNMWAVYAVSCEIGDGPVRRLPTQDLRDMRKERDRLLNELMAYENRSHATRGVAQQRTAYRDY